ncbi:MAG: hypothetical protein M0Z95_03335 [Actinomycetota bacterium]|nr:hypothetical protein [Actinomycetota bacterium]
MGGMAIFLDRARELGATRGVGVRDAAGVRARSLRGDPLTAAMYAPAGTPP